MMLDIPTAHSLTSQLTPPPTPRKEQLEYDFWIGPKDPTGESRLIRVVYSLEGEPINVIENHSRPPDDPKSMRVAAADFSITGNWFGLVSLVALDAAPEKFRSWSASQSSRDMTEPEIERARDLAVWLWDYRPPSP